MYAPENKLKEHHKEEYISTLLILLLILMSVLYTDWFIELDSNIALG